MADIREIAAMETKCTGCGACVNVCPQGAIRLVERNGYFLFPEIDAAKCNHCGLCLKKCPSAGPRPEPSKVTTEVAYGCYVKDEVERARSSSGGVFQALAKHVLKQGGVVCGARFTHGCHLEHVIIDKVEDLPPLQRSKYLQSNPGMVYAEIKRLLASGRKVLFVGTPCQVAACKSVVGASCGGLLTVDFMCHGVPPERLFQEHLNCIANGAEVKDICFRSKESEGWNLSHLTVDFGFRKYDCRQIDDVYFKGFAENMTIRRSCGDCRYARFPRQGDLTIGDLWEVAESDLKWKDNNGVSAVIVNTDRGKTLLAEVKNVFERMRSIRMDRVSSANNLQSHSYLHPNALRFYAALCDETRKKTADELILEYLDKDDGVCILNFHDGHSNYGSVLTGYALKEKIKSIIGYSPIHMHLWPMSGGEPPSGDLMDFNREYLPATELIRSRWHADKLNKHFRTFIAGPDVVWRNSGYTPDFGWFLFNFVRYSKNICSYAASFCYPRLMNLFGENATPTNPTESDVVERKRLMKRFSHISVREDSGVGICKMNFDVDAEHVLDSVFLLSAEDYSNLIGRRATGEHFDARYILNPSYSPPDLIAAISNNPASVSLRDGTGDYANRNVRDADGKLPKITGKNVREWLRLIRDCDHFVTDSFHGICFAIIFRRQFVALQPSDAAGTERVDSLLRMLGIPFDRYARSVADYEHILATPLDYSKIEPRLNEWIAKSEDYLRRVLADNKPNKTRDWLESIEMLTESLRPPVRMTLKQCGKEFAKRGFRQLRRYGILTDHMVQGKRKIGVLGFDMFTYLQGGGG